MAKLTLKQRTDKRTEIYRKILDFFRNEEEDIDFCVKGDTKTAILNFPSLIDNEECWIEIMVSIPTREDYDGYEKREDFKIAEHERKEKKQQIEEKKKKKIEHDKKLREQKKKEKEEKGE